MLLYQQQMQQQQLNYQRDFRFQDQDQDRMHMQAQIQRAQHMQTQPLNLSPMLPTGQVTAQVAYQPQHGSYQPWDEQSLKDLDNVLHCYGCDLPRIFSMFPHRNQQELKKLSQDMIFVIDENIKLEKINRINSLSQIVKGRNINITEGEKIEVRLVLAIDRYLLAIMFTCITIELRMFP